MAQPNSETTTSTSTGASFAPHNQITEKSNSKYIAEVDRQSKGIWLNSQYFADHGHCTCPRCQELFQKSGLGWLEWRRKIVTDYMEQIRDVVKKELVLSLQPDPVSSLERYGVDFDDFAKYADQFNVVMFSKNYATPWYWEMLARGLQKTPQKTLLHQPSTFMVQATHHKMYRHPQRC